MKISNMSARAILLAAMFLSPALWAQEITARSWGMKNGGTINAIGVSANFAGIIFKSPDETKQAFVAYDKMAPSEIKYAAENLPIVMGDSEKIKMGGKSISSTRDNYKVVTGYSISYPSSSTSSSSSGNSSSTSSGGIRATTKRAAKSSKLVELKMSSLTEGVAVRVDFLAIAFSGGSKRVVRTVSGVYFFKSAGEVALFEVAPMDDYHGWAFVFRSIESGEILGSAASGRHLEPYAEGYIKGKGKVAKESTAEIRKMILKAVSEN